MSSNLPPYVQALLKPDTYPERPARIELMQTQMSFIFLTGLHAYKSKKPVNLGYLDYTTLEQRKHFCDQELALNRRLAPGAYLDVLPVIETPTGFTIGGQGPTVEYVVKMKQLPQERMMDALLRQDRVTVEMAEQVAFKMAAFHKTAATSPEISSFGSLKSLKVNTDENFDQTEKYIDTLIPRRSFEAIKAFTDGFLAARALLFEARAKEGRIRDCHGDLHAAHVCFADDIYIYDCIEFNDRFRYCDIASEIAFLAMDLDRYARADLSQAFVSAYIRASRDSALAELLGFYKCYRAYVRGKVACFKHDDPLLKDKSAIAAEAAHYFQLAHLYALGRPLAIMVGGLIGTGKSTTARRLGRGLGFPVLSSDVIRKRLAGIPAGERHYDKFDSGLYSQESTRRTYAAMLNRADGLLGKGQSVILDASFSKCADRLAVKEMADRAGALLLAIECTAGEAAIKQRLEDRQKRGSVSDGRWEIFADIKRGYEPIEELPAGNILVLDTSASAGDTLSSVLQRITQI